MFLQYGDLRDTMSIRDVVAKAKPDYVFHLAAQSFPRTSFDAPLDTHGHQHPGHGARARRAAASMRPSR